MINNIFRIILVSFIASCSESPIDSRNGSDTEKVFDLNRQIKMAGYLGNTAILVSTSDSIFYLNKDSSGFFDLSYGDINKLIFSNDHIFIITQTNHIVRINSSLSYDVLEIGGQVTDFNKTQINFDYNKDSIFTVASTSYMLKASVLYENINDFIEIRYPLKPPGYQYYRDYLSNIEGDILLLYESLISGKTQYYGAMSKKNNNFNTSFYIGASRPRFISVYDNVFVSNNYMFNENIVVDLKYPDGWNLASEWFKTGDKYIALFQRSGFFELKPILVSLTGQITLGSSMLSVSTTDYRLLGINNTYIIFQHIDAMSIHIHSY